jgi:hypothetical protein
MKRIAVLTMLAFLLAAPAALLAQTEKHAEVGAFVDYYRFDRTNVINFLGVGGRAGFYVSPHTSVEGELAYDFERNRTNFFSNGATTTFTRTRTRPFHGLFGPKFDFGTGKANFFATGKVGFVNFASSDQTVGQAFGNVDTGNTRFAVYPGVGVEGFWGAFGLRAEVGDEIYFLNGARNNLRVTFGPHFRF